MPQMRMRTLWIPAALAVVVMLAACGGGGSDTGAGIDRTLRYFPKDTAAVVTVSTDLDSEQFRELDRIVERRTHRRLESYLREAVESDGTFSWDDEVKPLLGHELVVGVPAATSFFSGGVLVVLHASDGDRLRDAIESKSEVVKTSESHGAQLYRFEEDEGFLAIDDDVLLAAESESALRSALARADAGDGMSESDFRRALGDLPADALAQRYSDATTLLSIRQATVHQLLPRLAPHLPRLVAGLQGLDSEGEALLFLLAPDALTLQGEQIRVERAGDLWRVSGLTGEGPDTLFFGTLGDVFVVASTPELAHQVATEPTMAVDGARGAGVLRGRPVALAR